MTVLKESVDLSECRTPSLSRVSPEDLSRFWCVSQGGLPVAISSVSGTNVLLSVSPAMGWSAASRSLLQEIESSPFVVGGVQNRCIPICVSKVRHSIEVH
jgi:hypothetical protein